jgi:hypothetical protein
MASIALPAISRARRLCSSVDCRRFDFTVKPSSTRRRVASERVGLSGWFSAHLTMDARNTGAARNPIMGSRPVAGRPRFFGLAVFDICEYWLSQKVSLWEASNSTCKGCCAQELGTIFD